MREPLLIEQWGPRGRNWEVVPSRHTCATRTAIAQSGLGVVAWEVLGLWKFLEPHPSSECRAPSGQGLCVVEAEG